MHRKTGESKRGSCRHSVSTVLGILLMLSYYVFNIPWRQVLWDSYCYHYVKFQKVAQWHYITSPRLSRARACTKNSGSSKTQSILSRLLMKLLRTDLEFISLTTTSCPQDRHAPLSCAGTLSMSTFQCLDMASKKYINLMTKTRQFLM